MQAWIARLAGRFASALAALFTSDPRTPGGGVRVEAPRRMALA